MAIYTAPTQSGYNDTPPSDDGQETANNEVTWANIKDKLTDPNQTYAAAISDAVAAMEETNTWTPVLVFDSVAGTHTYGTQTGYYYIIGKLMFINIVLTLTNLDGTGSGNAYIELPPSPRTNKLSSSALQIGASNVSTLGGTTIGLGGAADELWLLDGPGGTQLTHADFTNTSSMQFSGVIRITA